MAEQNSGANKDSLYLKFGLATALLLATAPCAVAQETGGIQSNFTFGQRFEDRDESGFTGPSDAGRRSVTTLSFAASSETRTQRVSVDAATEATKNFTTDDDVSFEGTNAGLDYTLSNRDLALTFGARYRRDEIDDLTFDSTIVDEGVVTGEGLREVVTLSSRLEFGRASRVSGSVGYIFERSEFSETFDASLNDSDRRRIGAQLNFAVTGSASIGTFINFSEIDEKGAGAIDRETWRIGVNTSYSVSPATTWNADVAFTEDETSGEGFLTVTDGLTYGIGVEAERPNGIISARFDEITTINGKRRTLTFGRTLQFPRGDLNVSIGGTKTEGFDTQLLANLTYNYELDRLSNFSVTLSQTGDINSSNSEVVNTRLNVVYARALTQRSSTRASLAVVDENVLELGASNQRTIQFDIAYNFDIGADWDLTTGYQFSSVRFEGEEDRDVKTFFVGVQKNFFAQR